MKFGILKRLATVCLALALAVGVAGCSENNEKQTINIATGSTSGTYYPIGVAMAELITKDVFNVESNAQSTGASVANINMLKDGNVNMAIVQNDIAYYAINGTDMFDKKVDDLRGIASLYPETCQFVTFESSGIRTINDLRGKKVVVGAQGSGVEANVRQILKAYNITYDDIDEQFLSFAEGANALKDGTAEVLCLTAGYPTVSVQDVAKQKPIYIIPLDEDKITALTIDYPFYTKTVIPAGTYAGIDKDIPTVSVMAILVTTDKIDDKTGGDVTKAIFNNLGKLSEAHPVAKQITKERALAGMGFIKMNGGAEKFLKE